MDARNNSQHTWHNSNRAILGEGRVLGERKVETVYYGPIQAAPTVRARRLGGTKTHERPERGTGARAGFTLPELLVAMAIFLSIMGGVGLLFVNTIRTVRQGFQTQEVFEQARGTLNIIERDLSRAFTSRDHGDYYNFYGTPIGFTFVGLVSVREDSPDPNIARVTYVIHHDNTVRGQLSSIDEAVVYTYRLLRYVEPNIEDLDEFPVDWYNGTLALSYTENGGTVGELLDSLLLDDAFLNCRDGNACSGADTSSLTPRGIEILNAKKREVWIRMLSGGDYEVPNAWDADLAIQAAVWGPSGIPGPPDDYSVSENILDDYNFPFVDPVEPARVVTQYRSNAGQLAASGAGFLRISGGTFDDWPQSGYCMIKDGPIMREIVAYSSRSATDLSVPDGGRAQFGTNSAAGLSTDTLDIYPASFFTFTEFKDVNDVIQPQRRRYWNDLRNISLEDPGDNMDNDGDGLVDEVDDVGSPFMPRIPAQVNSTFTLFFESPYAGAPDFTRAFDQEIDIPTGYRRLPPG